MAERWQQDWLAVVAPDEPHKLSRRLRWDDLSEEGFRERLETTPASPDHLEQHWQECLSRCRQAVQQQWDRPLEPVGSEEGQRPFEDLWWPIRDHGLNLLRQELSGSEAINPAVLAQLADHLLTRLCTLGEQVLWELFNSERSPGMMLLAHLGTQGDGAGPPVREGYERFIRSHRRDGLEQLLDAFPELGRFIGTVVLFWLRGCSEMLQRINADRDLLEKVFAIPRDLPLNTVRQGLSDPHRGGRVVAVLGFGSGTDPSHRVVYKPKDMGVDVAYQALLSDLNSCSQAPPLRTLRVHSADGYGYMEHVQHQLAADEAELERFYANAGRLTAVLHLLGCTDCHYENLIAHGDQLLLIDTETLLEADVPDHIGAESPDSSTVDRSELQKRFQGSVLRSGLMPQWTYISAAKVPRDISALGIAPPPQAEQSVPGWLGLNSDGMMPGRITRPAEVPTSLPVGVGATNPFQRFIDPFCRGFERQSQMLIDRQQAWLGHNGLLNHFAGLRRRIVLRATRVYFAIQRQQLEPAALRSPLTQALKLEQLARSFLLAESKPLHWPVFAAELAQMQQLDIPFFTHAIDSADLDLDHHHTPLPGYIGTSGLTAARQRLSLLNQQEIDFQLRLIRGACMARQLRAEPGDMATANRAGTINKPDAAHQETSGLDAVERIMERLADLAIRDANGQIEWLGMDLGADGDSFSFGPVGLSLYGGASGIVCLSHRLQALQRCASIASTLQTSILQTLMPLLEQESAGQRLRWWRDQPLGLSGCGGILLMLQTIGKQAWGDTLLLSARERFIEADQQLDLIGGCAGLIGALLRQGSPEALALAVKAGEHLLQHQRADGAWPGKTANGHGLLGLSHGTAGHAAALAHLHQMSQEDRFRDGARAALAYERSHFEATAGNWPDFREAPSDASSPRFMSSWCHGAPGIGLARASLWNTDLWDDRCLDEITAAAETTIRSVSEAGDVDHLCCGKLGLMVILETLARGPWGLDPALAARCQSSAAGLRDNVLQRCTANHFDLRSIATKESALMLPGFFNGLSGMAMALLNDADSRRTTLNLLTAGLWELATSET